MPAHAATLTNTVVRFSRPPLSLADTRIDAWPAPPLRTLNEATYDPSARRVAVTVTLALPGWVNATVGFELRGSSVVNTTFSVCPGLTLVAEGVTANAPAHTVRASTTVPRADFAVRRATYRPCGANAPPPSLPSHVQCRSPACCVRPVQIVRTSAPAALYRRRDVVASRVSLKLSVEVGARASASWG